MLNVPKCLDFTDAIKRQQERDEGYLGCPESCPKCATIPSNQGK